MDCENTFDNNFLRIKEKLNRDHIKLWLPPYLSENHCKNDEELKMLADTFSEHLSIPADVCLQYLVQFQARALSNLKERNDFQQTGQASLKVRVPNEQGGSTLTISIALSQTGLALKEEICQAISVPLERLKVIFKGQFLTDTQKLDSQGVTHGLHMMAIILRENSDTNIPQHEECIKALDSTKEDIELLSESKYFQVADQSGKLLKLPKNERKSLISAMTLHEKGRVALKKEDFAFALVLLLEAEKEFRVWPFTASITLEKMCNSSLRSESQGYTSDNTVSVDNYGVLTLDIVWCYLNLQSVTQLPDAEERLLQCERSFIQSYGADLERLTALKGFTGNEAALFMRLHLLQAIVLYHQSKLSEARSLLQKAEEELKKLEVDDSQLCQLIELGYGTSESRLALRASGGDINAAVSIIENKRQEKQRREEIEHQERKLHKKRKKLGKCLNGEWIEPQLHDTLMSMGFNAEISKWALAQTNNNINIGINLINETPELFANQFADKEPGKYQGESLQQVINIGFDASIAKQALKKHKGDSQKAIDELLTNDGVITPFDSDSASSSSGSSFDQDNASEPSTSELIKRKTEAYTRLAEGFSHNEDDHLDLNLVPEVDFLRKYKELMREG